MKRLFVFILALIVAAASVVPCCPADGCTDEVTHAAPGKMPVEKGVCSPFSNCAGCSGFVYVPKYIHIAELPVETTIHYEQAIAFNIAPYSSSLFQPPRC